MLCAQRNTNAQGVEVQYWVFSIRGQHCPCRGGVVKIRVGSTSVQNYLREAGVVTVPLCVHQRAALT